MCIASRVSHRVIFMKFFRSAWERVLVQALNFSRFQFLVQDGVADFEKQVKRKKKRKKKYFPPNLPPKKTQFQKILSNMDMEIQPVPWWNRRSRMERRFIGLIGSLLLVSVGLSIGKALK